MVSSMLDIKEPVSSTFFIMNYVIFLCFAVHIEHT